MKKTLGCVRKADTDYQMIVDSDRIAVGVSGGKDSLLLLHALSLYRQFSHKNFSVEAITVTMGLEPFDLSGIQALCDALAIPYHILPTQIGEIIFEHRKEKNPCSLCSKMRRAALLNCCRSLGLNKLALGHHREDAIETLLMSLFYEGRFHTFQPKSYMTRTEMTVIRPLIYLPEKHVLHMQKVLQLPVVASPCPADGNTSREAMKDLMRQLKKRFPDAPERFLHALQQRRADLWQPEEEK